MTVLEVGDRLGSLVFRGRVPSQGQLWNTLRALLLSDSLREA